MGGSAYSPSSALTSLNFSIGELEIGAGMRGADLRADAGLALRDDGDRRSR